jgi:tetratricopeptide (TPR) repeat protein
LRRLSVFSGSFTLEAAEAICADGAIPIDEVLTLLGRLVDKSLLNVDPKSTDPVLSTRYRFLDTICSFGRMKLDETEETRWMRDRHAEYYVHLVEAAEPELLLRNQVRWFKLLQVENDNLRAVVEWSVESNQAESALRLVGAMLWFWFSNGSSREGHDLALKALALPSEARLINYRARALNTAGLMQCFLGDTASARRSLEEALAILRTLSDEASLAWSLEFLGLVFAFAGIYDKADAAFKEGLDITRKLGGTQSNNFLHFLGDIDLLQGDRSRAKKIYEESAQILQSLGSKSFLAYPLRRLGYLALWQDDLQNAWKYFQESLTLNQEISDKRAIAACLISMAAIAIRLDRPLVAAKLYGAVETMLESLSLYLHYLDQAELEKIKGKMQSCLDETSFTNAVAEGWEMSEEQAIGMAKGIFSDEP